MLATAVAVGIGVAVGGDEEPKSGPLKSASTMLSTMIAPTGAIGFRRKRFHVVSASCLMAVGLAGGLPVGSGRLPVDTGRLLLLGTDSSGFEVTQYSARCPQSQVCRNATPRR